MHLKNKRIYEQKCREVDGVEDALKKSVSLVSKDEEKVIVKYRLQTQTAYVPGCGWFLTHSLPFIQYF